MGSEVAPRKDFIVVSAHALDCERLDALDVESLVTSTTPHPALRRMEARAPMSLTALSTASKTSPSVLLWSPVASMSLW